MKTIELTVEIWHEGNMYTAYCHELDVATAGKTPEEAKRNIHEALDIFFQETARKGTLRELLEEGGFNVTVEGPERIASRTKFHSVHGLEVVVEKL